MRRTLAALAFACLATSAHAGAPLAPGVTAHPDWSAGYEAAYLDLCEISQTERAKWASPASVTKGPRIDRGQFAAGFIAATEDAHAYDEQGFDRMEWCGDNHP